MKYALIITAVVIAYVENGRSIDYRAPVYIVCNMLICTAAILWKIEDVIRKLNPLGQQRKDYIFTAIVHACLAAA